MTEPTWIQAVYRNTVSEQWSVHNPYTSAEWPTESRLLRTVNGAVSGIHPQAHALIVREHEVPAHPVTPSQVRVSVTLMLPVTPQELFVWKLGTGPTSEHYDQYTQLLNTVFGSPSGELHMKTHFTAHPVEGH